jgi:hypothetical protein
MIIMNCPQSFAINNCAWDAVVVKVTAYRNKSGTAGARSLRVVARPPRDYSHEEFSDGHSGINFISYFLIVARPAKPTYLTSMENKLFLGEVVALPYN